MTTSKIDVPANSIRRWKCWPYLQRNVALYGHLTLTLTTHRATQTLPDEEALRIADGILEPLRKASSTVSMYRPLMDLERINNEALPITRKRGKLIWGDAPMHDALPLLIKPNAGEGCTVLFELTSWAAPAWPQLFENCYDPDVMINIAACSASGAIRRARQKRKEGRAVAVLSQVNSGLELLDLIVNDAPLQGLLVLAADYCKTTDPFKRCNNPEVAHWPPLPNHAVYGTAGFRE